MSQVQCKSTKVGIVVGVLVFVATLFAYVCLGMFTDLIAMCGGAAIWWVNTYFICALGIPAVAIWAGVAAKRSSLRRSAAAST
jgi:hypothetical protein